MSLGPGRGGAAARRRRRRLGARAQFYLPVNLKEANQWAYLAAPGVRLSDSSDRDGGTIRYEELYQRSLCAP